MTKKILLILGILVVVGIAVFLILYSPPQKEDGGKVGFSIREFFPFGKNTNPETSGSTTPADQSEPINNELNIQINKPVPRLRKISNEPAAGAVIFNTGTTSVVRFVEKGTGNVYEAKSDSVVITRLTNTTIPKIIRAFWLPNGSGFLAQTLMVESEIIETSFVKLNKNNVGNNSESLVPFNTTISKLPTDIKEIAIKPDSTKIFYYIAKEVSAWFISNPDGTNKSLVMSHPLTEWLPKWVSPDILMIQNKSSSESVGYVYSFDIKNKIFKKVGVGAVGLSFSPNTDGSLSLMSIGGEAPQLSVVDNKKITVSDTITNGLAEKCVWSKDKVPSVYCAIPNQIPSGNYPDVWYKGIVSTEDSIKKIKVIDNIFYDTINLSKESGEKIDVVDISLSPDETHLIFRNKADGYLWMLRIEE